MYKEEKDKCLAKYKGHKLTKHWSIFTMQKQQLP